MKKITTSIIFILLVINGYSQNTLRKGFEAVENSDTASLKYSNNVWEFKSNTTLNTDIDTANIQAL